MTTKHTTVILPNKEIQNLKDQVTKLTSERDLYQKQAITAEIKVEKMKLLMSKEQLDELNNRQPSLHKYSVSCH